MTTASAFAMNFPEQPNMPQANIADELTEFAFASDGTAWWKPAFLVEPRGISLQQNAAVCSQPLLTTPVTIKLADGTHVALHEAALVDYSGMAVDPNGRQHTACQRFTPGAG